MTLRYETQESEIYNALKKIKRTGWVIREVEEPETVYDHTVSLLQLANRLKPELQLSEEDFDDLLHILEIHDWAEALVGDEFIPNEDAYAYRARKIIKAKHEQDAMQQLLTGKPYAATVYRLFERYESGVDTVAKLAKYQALELALRYEEEQGVALFKEFDDYYERDGAFSNPIILKHVGQLRDKHSSLSK